MTDKEIAKPDLTTGKPAAPDTVNPAPDNTAKPVENQTPLFDAAGSVAPSAPTPGAKMPEGEAMPEKRGRGRPRKDGGTTKPGSKPAVKAVSAENSIARANAEMVVSVVDLLRAGISGGECPENAQMRGACVEAWDAYLAESEGKLPPWVQVSIVTAIYTAPALATKRGGSLLSGIAAKVKGWWIARRG